MSGVELGYKITKKKKVQDTPGGIYNLGMGGREGKTKYSRSKTGEKRGWEAQGQAGEGGEASLGSYDPEILATREDDGCGRGNGEQE